MASYRLIAAIAIVISWMTAEAQTTQCPALHLSAILSAGQKQNTAGIK